MNRFLTLLRLKGRVLALLGFCNCRSHVSSRSDRQRRTRQEVSPGQNVEAEISAAPDPVVVTIESWSVERSPISVSEINLHSTEGVTKHLPSGEIMSICDLMKYQQDGVPLVILEVLSTEPAAAATRNDDARC